MATTERRSRPEHRWRDILCPLVDFSGHRGHGLSLYGLFADLSTVGKHLNNLSSFVPGGAIDVIGEQMRHVAAQGSRRLGVAFLVGLAVSLWSANAGIKALFDALNIVHGEQERRGFIKLNMISLAFTAAAIVFVLLSVATMVILPIALDYLGLSSATRLIFGTGSWPALLAVVALGIAAIYRYAAMAPDSS